MDSINKKNKNNKTADGIKLPKTAQDTIPYTNVYRSGLIETSLNTFSKSYKLMDINFRIASQEDQEKIFKKYGDFLNSFNEKNNLQITINNRNVDEKEVLDTVLCKMENDDFNELRVENNNMLKAKMSEGRNNLVSDKYLTISGKYESLQDAKNSFSRIDSEVSKGMKLISGTQEVFTPPLTIQQRLKCLHDILNPGHEKNLSADIDFDKLSQSGLTTKDIIAPPGFRFEMDYFRMGDKFARALFIKDLPSSLSTDFISDIADLPFNFTATFNIKPIAQDKALKITSRQNTSIQSNVIQAQKDAYRNGYSGDLISPDLKYASEQSEAFLEDLRTGKQKAFLLNAIIMHYADTKEELKKDTESIYSIGNKNSVTIEKLVYYQEEGFKSALPLGYNDLSIERMSPTNTVSLFIPFTVKELLQKGGFYYGLNASSHNLLLINRLAGKNPNALILGLPGSGKSFCAKREMINVFLITQDEIYVIDPEGEYTYMAKQFNGSVIKLEPGSTIHINPFDMDIHYGDDAESANNDPVKMKSDYICMLCETAMGGRYELNSVQKSIIDRVVNEVYKPYMKHMRDIAATGVTCDVTKSPTMDTFYDMLMHQPEPEAQNIALSLEIYCRGSFDTFAHRTNVDINNRFTVYNIKDIGTGMMEMGLQVCLNHIWNKIIDNSQKSSGQKRTWFYVDEFHILTKNRTSASFLQQIFKRARKWNGIPTAITQNVEDLLVSEESRGIINNCEFIIMLAQSPFDRAALAEMYHISESQLDYITNSPSGQGLIYTGKGIVPFIDDFPQDTKLYKMMTSKADERVYAA